MNSETSTSTGPQKIVEDRRVTVDVRLLVGGEEVIVETPWAVSTMPVEKLINLILVYGSLRWKAHPGDNGK
ncbi:MAG: hypothetical protein Q8S13_11945 [Dehalococcoidia bacterium]|nr:hypothetical protein [Dehalococcoidia bacterium]